MYMVAFLHTRHRVTFRAAGLILLCLGFIFSSLVGNFAAAVEMPRTLKTVFSKFDINDHFAVLPICFHCHHVFELDIEEEVFGGTKRHNYDAWEDADADPEDSDDPPGSGKRKPYMVSPIQLLSTGLQEFFKRPGMVSAVNSWRTRTEVDGELRCMQDARVWKELKDGDGYSFFFSPKAEEEEIRLGVSFSLDWFKRSKSSFAPSQSSGVMSFCVQNLTNSLRYRSENLIFSGGTGQKEPAAAQLQHYLKIIVDDLIMLYDDGIMIHMENIGGADL
ncbi:hypothetical protein B0H10DRAFT_2112485 [Mycena sp. CBHHK59/15]|nr:hypothetical protein B0H10DRAFT_2112485 [Mycena sp. CBHHK59/15]